MEENYRYIVYINYIEDGILFPIVTKENNKIEDIVAIVKSEERAKQLCKERDDLKYKQIIWEE